MIHLPRDGWNGDGLPRLGHWVDPAERVGVVIHHTVTLDRDAAPDAKQTPNVWETVEEIAEHMRRLQTIRPDLGLDVPYNLVVFVMPDLDLVLAEGRGLYRTGAHQPGWNRKALGIAFAGNFENDPGVDLAPYVSSVGRWLANLSGLGFNLQEIHGHRDLKATACPGEHLYNALWRIAGPGVLPESSPATA